MGWSNEACRNTLSLSRLTHAQWCIFEYLYLYLSFCEEATGYRHTSSLFSLTATASLDDVFVSICICICICICIFNHCFVRKPQATGTLHFYSGWHGLPAPMMCLWVFVFVFVFSVLLGSASTGTLHLYSGWHALPASMMYLASLPLSDLFIIDLNIFDDRFGFFLLSRFAYHCLPCFGCQNFDDFKQIALE